MNPELIDSLAIKNQAKIVFLIMDGLGGLPMGPGGETELESAATPNMDDLVKRSICGLLDPVGPGITPGSGPAHFALFGYDPVKNNIGRGLLEAAGIDFPMTEDDLLIRVNFSTVNSDGILVDRRAGRIDTGENQRICRKLQDNIKLSHNIDILFEPVREHRALLVVRGKGLHEDIEETDPQKTGMKPNPPRALKPGSKSTSEILSELVEKAVGVLADEPKANMLLLRGYSKYKKFPSMQSRFGLKSVAIASYPMYRGIARLLGMTVLKDIDSLESEFSAIHKNYDDYDFFFVHVKPTDSRGEDGDFHAKVKVIEQVDNLLPKILELKPEVLIVTGDHSTPAALASHSWHPVPVLLAGPTCRPDRVEKFGEEIAFTEESAGCQPFT